MQMSKSLFAMAIMGAGASTASAAIIPSWRVNTITPAAIAAAPVLANAVSVSLMVELTGGSLFNVAGLDLSSLPILAGVQYYNHLLGTDTIPTNALFPIFPDLEFDSYVATTVSQQPSIPGRLNGTGPAQVGTADQYNVAWGATPNTGGAGLREIARITMLDFIPGISIPIPLSNGLVADSLNPNVNVALPPMPTVIPEPMSFAVAGLGLMALRRK